MGVLAGSIILFFWKLVFTHQYDWIWGPDLTEQVLPWFEFQAREFHAGRFPLWDPSLWAGQPLFGLTQPGTAYPLNWILFALPLNSAGHIARASLEWYFVAIHIMAAIFAFALIRDLGLSRGAGVVAGLFYSLGGFFGKTGWPQHLNGAVWAPLILLFVFRVMRGRKPYMSAIWAGVCQGCAWLSGHHEIPIYTSLAALILFAWLALRRGAVRWQFVHCAALFVLFTGGMGAFQILPSYEFGRLAMRFGAPGGFQWNQYVPYAVHVSNSFSPVGINGLIFATLQSDLVMYVGVVALALGIFGAISAWSAGAVAPAAALALAGLLYSLGGSNVIQGAMYSLIPELNRARHPMWTILLFDLGLAILLAYGVDALPASENRPKLMRFLLCFGVAGFGVLAVINMTDALKVDTLMGMAPLMAVLLAAVLWAVSRGLSPVASVTAIAILLAIELGGPSAYQIADLGDPSRAQFLDRMRSNEDVAAFLRSQPGPFRIKTDGKELPDNWASLHGLETTAGYIAGVTNNIINLNPNLTATQELLGVRYRISRDALPAPYLEVFQGKSGLRVFRDDAAFPRAWFAQASAPIPAGMEKTPIAGVDLARLRTVALTHGSPAPLRDCSGDGEIRYLRYTAARSELQVAAPCDRILVVAETWFPGWEGRIDGKPSAVLEVDGALKGLVVPAGTHVIDFAYRPRSVFLGAGVTLFFAIAAVFCEFRTRRGMAS